MQAWVLSAIHSLPPNHSNSKRCCRGSRQYTEQNISQNSQPKVSSLYFGFGLDYSTRDRLFYLHGRSPIISSSASFPHFFFSLLTQHTFDLLQKLLSGRLKDSLFIFFASPFLKFNKTINFCTHTSSPSSSTANLLLSLALSISFLQRMQILLKRWLVTSYCCYNCIISTGSPLSTSSYHIQIGVTKPTSEADPPNTEVTLTH